MADILGPPLVVGFEDEALKIKERLVGKSKHLDVISIVGMPGIGKTTLALKVYNDGYVAHQFYIRAWISVSQVYNTRDLLLGILRSPHINPTQRDDLSDELLKQELYKRLKGKRYLIFLDDIWDIEPWEDLKRCFPNDNNGSRIMFTSRIRDVALRANSILHDMRFLSKDESWDVGLLNPSKPFDLFGLPTSLKQITLSEFRFDWKDISKLARLPNLEVLKLVDNAFKGKLWDTNLLESNFQPFPKLKLLKFKSLDIVQWNASMDHFPSLQRLVLNMCFKLKEIPSDLGDIVTLEKIEVNWSSHTHTLACSARKILEEQQDKGNEQLEIFIYPPDL